MQHPAAREPVRRRPARAFVAATVAYAVIIALGVALLDESSPTWAGVLVAVAAAVPALAMLVVGAANDTRREGVERTILHQSTSLAFFLTMAAALSYGLLEAFAGFATTSAWWFYGVGMVSWGVVATVLQRRMA